MEQDEIWIGLIDWCRYHYGGNLVGLALFDPTPVEANFPHGEINILLVLRSAPAQERARYDTVGEILVKSLIPGKKVTCRIQTGDELNTLADLKLPLLGIYLTHAEIIYDPHGVLRSLRATLP